MNESNNVTRTVDNTTSKGRTVKISRLPMYAGSQWMKDGLKQTARNPHLVLWVALTLAIFYTLSYFIETYIGNTLTRFSAFLSFFLTTTLLFILSANLIAIYRGIARGEKPSLKMFVTPTKEGAISLLILSGLACLAFAGTTVTMSLVNLFTRSDWSLFDAIFSLAIQLILATLFLIAFYFSPLLIAFHKYNAIDSVRHSFFTCLKNWKPLLFNFVAIILASVILFFFPLYIISDFLLYYGSSEVYSFIVRAFSVIFVCVFYANYYQSYNALFSDFSEQIHPATGNGTSPKTGLQRRVLAAALITIVILAAIIGLIANDEQFVIGLAYMWPITLILTPLVIVFVTNLVCFFMNTPRGVALRISLGLIFLLLFFILSLF
jgi:hypothetical protein